MKKSRKVLRGGNDIARIDKLIRERQSLRRKAEPINRKPISQLSENEKDTLLSILKRLDEISGEFMDAWRENRRRAAMSRGGRRKTRRQTRKPKRKHRK
jgi:NTP pyrophosphatase (non-canonical NTP hydrolase)